MLASDIFRSLFMLSKWCRVAAQHYKMHALDTVPKVEPASQESTHAVHPVGFSGAQCLGFGLLDETFSRQLL
jgi:hypothetical protein